MGGSAHVVGTIGDRAVEVQQAVLVHVAAHHQRGRRAAEQASEPVAMAGGRNR